MGKYFLYSGAIHFVIFIAFFVLGVFAINKKQSPVYKIDFISSKPSVTTTKNAVKKPKLKTAAKKDVEKYNTKKEIAKQTAKSEKISLGAPSILEEPAEEIFASAPGLRMDFPNFPYPWYITQVRNLLWQEWKKREPSPGYLCLVSFAILKNGKIDNLLIDKNSGNKTFDYVALSSTKNAAPFPALPKDYKKDDLTVTVEYKTN
ncbi:MAG: TonB family protein [Elusimicrobiaceae bacterium]|jgi:TonB family protein|nr:TonB family protein [Elusimicrobiaceae bacterium]MBT3955410.1 TonB family protein [Elusimicrobiaceae bacterium]MBT4007687.1 TonB family protein [Elusimicrobiaceae bacterium]MBT4402303.1 TonB family protein [Elusimicrobiaceae bacterium]MBT4439536.1 TonB family protein [Elusimicrobiaceae bacterium]